jgi:hypothetical protein
MKTLFFYYKQLAKDMIFSNVVWAYFLNPLHYGIIIIVQ